MEDIKTEYSNINADIEDRILKINETFEGNRFVLYYPVYVNTYALPFLLEKNFDKINTKFELKIFNWNSIVPETLMETLENKNSPDIIYCFSSIENENIFKNRIKEFIEAKHLPYEISQRKAIGFQEEVGINTDIEYSNYAIKYLFFENKININKIHEFGNIFFKPKEADNPYLTKLLSLLLARGYKTIQLKTEIQDESKSLVRKLLHEEFGFKFNLTPNSHEYKANNMLVFETKGGQQSFEEIERQKDTESPSALKTFIIPNKRKYTSTTKLIAIYKKKTDENAGKIIRSCINSISKRIFLKEQNYRIFENTQVFLSFLTKSIESVVEGVKNPEGYFSEDKFKKFSETNPFIKSLQLYGIKIQRIQKFISDSITNEEKLWENEKFLKLVRNKAKSLKIDSDSDFIKCLNDHHVNDTESEAVDHWEHDFESEHNTRYIEFCKLIIQSYGNFKDPSDDEEDKLRLLVNGFFLIKLVLKNPNGINKDQIGDDIKQNIYIEKVTEEKKIFFDALKEPSSSDFGGNFIDYYNNIRIVAEDLNFLIVDEQLLGNPKIIFKIFSGFDLTQFEYLYSIDFASKFTYNANPAS